MPWGRVAVLRRGCRRTMFAAFALAAALLASCAPKGPPLPPEFPFPSGRIQSFVLGNRGFVALPAGQAPGSTEVAGAAASAGPGGSSLLPLALRVAGLAADSSATTLMAALNRFGIGILRLSPDGLSWKLLNQAVGIVESSSVAGLWPRQDGFLLELYHDPFIKGLAPRTDLDPELLMVSSGGLVSRLERLGEAGEDLFALFPAPNGSWYAELRSEKALGASTRYLQLSGPAEKNGAKALPREVFEASLSPRPLSLAPACLREATAMLGKGPFLVHARNAEGSELWWLSGGRLDEAKEVFAWIGKGEEDAIGLMPSGDGAWVMGNREAKAFHLEAPLQGGRYTAVAAIFGKVLAAAWETGSFPEVSASGMTVGPLPAD